LELQKTPDGGLRAHWSRVDHYLSTDYHAPGGNLSLLGDKTVYRSRIISNAADCRRLYLLAGGKGEEEPQWEEGE